jgi:YVTN family beta-propeller protein
MMDARMSRAGFVALFMTIAPLYAQSSGSAILSPEGDRAFFLSLESGRVAVVDTATGRLVREIFAGASPRGIAHAYDRLFVTCEFLDDLAVIDAATLNVIGRWPVSAEPYGVVYDSWRGLLFVASSAEGVVDVIPTVGEGAGRIWTRIPVPAKPKGVALSPDGARLYVTHFFTGQVSIIDPVEFRLLETVPAPPSANMMQKVAFHPDGRAFLPHILSNSETPEPAFNTAVSPRVTVLDPEGARASIDLSIGAVSANLPFDATFSPDGSKLYVAHLGSGDLTVVPLEDPRRLSRIDVGDGPRGVVVTGDGRKAYVVNSLSEDISIVDLAAGRETGRIAMTPSSQAPVFKRGKTLFFSSRPAELSRDRWLSCASCHFEGEHDARTWNFPPGPRNTTSLRGAIDTRPLHWSADRDEVQDFEHTIRDLQGGTGLIRGRAPNPELGEPNERLSADLDAVATYVTLLSVRRNPFPPDRIVERGREIFFSPATGCASCHLPPRFTDSDPRFRPVHDVGTGDGIGERLGRAFDTPSLRGVWDAAPYMHDGSAATLRDVVTQNPGDRHGRTSHLTDEEIDALVRFLRSL